MTRRDGKRKESLCPVCDSTDAVQNIGTIIDGGIVNSVGSHGGLVGQFGTTNLGYYGGINLSTSQSELARRLSVPFPEASFQYSLLFVGICIPAPFIYSWLTKGNDPSDGAIIYWLLSFAFGVIPGLPLGWLLGTLFKKLEHRSLAQAIEQASEASTYVRTSFYCSRDDLAFSSDFSGRPERFIDMSLNKFQSN